MRYRYKKTKTIVESDSKLDSAIFTLVDEEDTKIAPAQKEAEQPKEVQIKKQEKNTELKKTAARKTTTRKTVTRKTTAKK